MPFVMVDDSHATGFMGEHGRGTHEYCGVMGRVDIITSTLARPWRASGGFTAASKPIVDLLGKNQDHIYSAIHLLRYLRSIFKDA